jgi:hypothetical protein
MPCIVIVWLFRPHEVLWNVPMDKAEIEISLLTLHSGEWRSAIGSGKI